MTKVFFAYAPYGLAYVLTLGSVWGFHQGGVGFYLGLGLFFVLHPLLDNFLFTKLIISSHKPASVWALFYLCLSPLVLSGVLMDGLMLSSRNNTFENIGLVLSSGAISGVLGINIAHELVHRREKWLRGLGVYLLMSCHFAHWGISHVFCHHKHVATPLDSATARKNEPVYLFWLRAYFGGLSEAIAIENKKKSLFRHRIFWYALGSLVLSWIVYFSFGPAGLFFWWGQSLVAILLLETVDYIEHYGLVREKNPETGVYAPFKAPHAWDTRRALTNYVLFNLGFHSSHHLKTILTYPELHEQSDARQMPYGYSLMALIALVPSLYFKIMNPRLEKSLQKNT